VKRKTQSKKSGYPKLLAFVINFEYRLDQAILLFLQIKARFSDRFNLNAWRRCWI
jgi:hypothetical protein